MSTTEESKYCGLCLVTNVKMYNLNSVWILETFTQLLQQSPLVQQQYICYICVHLLRKFKDFRSQCAMVHQVLLTNIQPETPCLEVTKQDTKFINKVQTGLMCAPIVAITNLQSNNTTKKEEISRRPQVSQIVNTDRYTLTLSSSFPFKEENSDSDESYRNENTDASEIYNDTRYNKTNIDKNILNKKDVNHSTSLQMSPNVKRNEKKVIKKNLTNTNKTVKKTNNNNTTKKRKLKGAVLNNKKQMLDNYENDFKVVYLTLEDIQKDVLRRKEKYALKKFPFTCHYCYRGYVTKAAMTNHMKNHSPDYGSVECDICHLRFLNKTKLKNHFLNFHGRKFICKSCPYKCSTRGEAGKHMDLHKGIKYPCKECDKIFIKRCSLMAHMSTIHVSDCVCDICGSAFPSLKGMNCHKHIRHKNEKNEGKGPKCEDCAIQFSTNLAFKRHLVLSPKHDVRNGCKVCGETFPDVKTLKYHVKEHQEHFEARTRHPDACRICEARLNSRSEYHIHMMSLHPHADETKLIEHQRNNPNISQERVDPLVCDICGKVLHTKAHFLVHKRKHTGERPFTCPECNHTFVTKRVLDDHLQIHSSTRPSYTCSLCPKQYLTLTALAKHQRATHLGLRPHKCEICGKAFLNKCEVRLHTKYVHLKEPWPKRDRSKRKANRGKKDEEDDDRQMY